MIEEHEHDQDRLTGTIKFYKENVDFSKSSLCLQKFNSSFLSLNTAHEVSHEC